MKIFKFLIGLFVGVLLLVVYVQQFIVIKFSYVVVNDIFKGKVVEMFVKKVVELIKGWVKVEVYVNLILYKDKEEMEVL